MKDQKDQKKNNLEDLERFSVAEENYIKSIFSIAQKTKGIVKPQELSKEMRVKSASVTSILKKLQKNDLIEYKPYQGVCLKEKGEKLALLLLRKHRLWESFLYKKLHFNWNQIHKVAEQLEHVQSILLIDRLEKLLGHPKFDPHGDPIPDKNGKMAQRTDDLVTLSEIKTPGRVKLERILEENQDLYQHLEKINLNLGDIITIKNFNPFDFSITAAIQDRKDVFFSQQIAKALLVQRL